MPQRTTADLWNYAGAVFASVGYAAALILLVKRGALGRLRRALAAVGQMAFTNYLLQSVITSVVFLGWGFGLAGRFDYAQQLIVVAAIWAFQLVVESVGSAAIASARPSGSGDHSRTGNFSQCAATHETPRSVEASPPASDLSLRSESCTPQQRP